MFALLKGLIDSARQTDEIKILLIGLSGSGKSTFLQTVVQMNDSEEILMAPFEAQDSGGSLEHSEPAATAQPKCFPTVGLNSISFIFANFCFFEINFVSAEKILFKSKILLFWDVGGQPSMRHSWNAYLKEAAIVLFFVDSLEIYGSNDDWKRVLSIIFF